MSNLLPPITQISQSFIFLYHSHCLYGDPVTMYRFYKNHNSLIGTNTTVGANEFLINFDEDSESDVELIIC